MRWPSRRHRGSQTEAPAPVYRMHVVAPDTDPVKVAQEFAATFGYKLPPKLTARQVLTASLRKADFLAEGHVQALADGILLDLDEHGLTIVANGEVE